MEKLPLFHLKEQLNGKHMDLDADLGSLVSDNWLLVLRRGAYF